jgi:hypothetical protein
MKTKELIEELKKLDPNGNAEVAYANGSILGATCEPAYYDGRLVKASKFDDNGLVSEVEVTTAGTKINLYALDVGEWYLDRITDYLEEPIINIGGGSIGGWLEKEWQRRKKSYLKETREVCEAMIEGEWKGISDDHVQRIRDDYSKALKLVEKLEKELENEIS